MHALEIESLTFKRAKAELRSKSPGQYVLIKGEQSLGIFEDRDTAEQAGMRRLGHVPFLVKAIVEHEKPLFFPWPRFAEA